MPLSKIQSEVLHLLAVHRDPESYVAGSTPLNLNSPRFSSDIDVFHDKSERAFKAAEEDTALLQKHGYDVKWVRQELSIHTAFISRGGDATKLEWVVDSDFRFFPTISDETFGYLLHPVDLATNKVAAAYGRQEPRDIVDLITAHDRILPLGATIWGSAGKALGLTPEGIVNEIRRTSRYTEKDFRKVESEPPLDPAATMIRLRALLEEAEAFVLRMPTDKVGLLFLEGTKVVQPDPDHLDKYQTHAGQRLGHWPSSPEISAAMFEKALSRF